MRRIIVLAAASAFTASLAAGPYAWAQDVRPPLPAPGQAPTPSDAEIAPDVATDAAAKVPARSESDAPPPPLPATSEESARPAIAPPPGEAPPPTVPGPKPGDPAPPPPRTPEDAKKSPPKPSLAEAGGSAVGGILASAAGTAAGGPLGGAAAGFVGNKIGGGLVRGVEKIFGGGKKKNEAPAQQQAAAQTGDAAPAASGPNP